NSGVLGGFFCAAGGPPPPPPRPRPPPGWAEAAVAASRQIRTGSRRLRILMGSPKQQSQPVLWPTPRRTRRRRALFALGRRRGRRGALRRPRTGQDVLHPIVALVAGVFVLPRLGRPQHHLAMQRVFEDRRVLDRKVIEDLGRRGAGQPLGHLGLRRHIEDARANEARGADRVLVDGCVDQCFNLSPADGV